MPLQIRVKHALGGQTVDVPDRPRDQPFLIGRAAGVEVQIPSASVAPRQLAFFVHDGYWFIQDHSGTGTTFVNQKPIAKPQRLHIGDIVHAGGGHGAATIEICPDAAAAGQSGHVTTAVVQQAAAQHAAYTLQPKVGSAPRVPPRHQRAMASQRAGQQEATPAPSATDVFNAELASAARAATSPIDTEQQRGGDSSVMAAIVIVFAALIIGGIIYAFMKFGISSEPPAKPVATRIEQKVETPAAAPPPPTSQQPDQPKKLFDINTPPPEKPATTAPPRDPNEALRVVPPHIPAVRPPGKPDLGSPNKAIRAYLLAMQSGDVSLIRQVTIGRESDYDQVAILQSAVQANLNLNAAARDKWGDDGQGVWGPGRPLSEAELKATVNGYRLAPAPDAVTAAAYPKEGDQILHLRNLGGSWRIDLGATFDTLTDEERTKARHYAQADLIAFASAARMINNNEIHHPQDIVSQVADLCAKTRQQQ